MFHPLLTLEEEQKLVERFWERTNKAGPNECWEWKGHIKHGKGYGYIRIRPSNKEAPIHYSAHRLSWYIQYGAQPPKPLVVCHSCDNKKCVNIKHLWTGLIRHNTEDAFRKGAKIWSNNEGARTTPRKKRKKTQRTRLKLAQEKKPEKRTLDLNPPE